MAAIQFRASLAMAYQQISTDDWATMKVEFQKMFFNVKDPVYATDGSGCFDIYSHGVIKYEGPAEIHRTGIKMAVPADHVLLLFSRSGHGFKDNTRLANCVGVIDSDYRGEILVKIVRDDGDRPNILVGERIVQGMIIPRAKVVFNEVNELDSTARGEGGFGSTNV